MVENIDLSKVTGLHTKAILVNVTIGTWSGRKFDNEATKTVAENFDANTDCGRFNKLLINGSAILKLQRIGAQARRFHYTHTLPWNDVGTRLLPTKAYIDYVNGINKIGDEFWNAVTNFYTDYPSLVNDRKIALGSLWKENDYPLVEDIKGYFHFDVAFTFLPDPGSDIRLNLNDIEVEKIKSNMVNNNVKVVENSEKDLWERMRKIVNRIVDRLSDSDKVFKHSTFDNIDELERLISLLNVTDNVEIDDTMKKIKHELKEFSPDEIRTDDLVRQTVHRKATDILNKIDAFM